MLSGDIGNLINLRELQFNYNNINLLPVEISELINLEDLFIYGNNYTSIPQAICDMETTYGTNIYKSDGVTCVP